MAVIRIEEPKVRSPMPSKHFALFALGFRPFYLLAALLAVVAIPLWLGLLNGAVTFSPALPSFIWHGHEMVFGFASAVVVGFLFTAVRNWTGLLTPTKWPLAILATIWLIARIALLTGPLAIAMFFDLLFLPLAAIGIGRPLFKAGNRKNYFIIAVLLALACANALVYIGTFGWINAIAPTLGLHLGIALISVLATVIAGRIIPSFTANALRVQPWRNSLVDRAAITLTALALFSWALNVPYGITGIFAALAATVQVVRCWGWRPLPTFRVPLLWILHLSHSWIILALVMLALTCLGWDRAGSTVTHLLTVGGMSGLILGMITRTALGHTGRMLVAGKVEFAAYVLLQIALLARILPIMIMPDFYIQGLTLAGGAWVLAFGLYLWRYAPMLVRARVDGKEG